MTLTRRAESATCGLGLVATLAVAACGTTAGSPGDHRPPSAGHGGSSAGGSSGGEAGHPGGVRRCRADQLAVDLGSVQPAAGNRYAPLVFTNDSGRTCGLRGYPGVTVLDGDKEQIGTDAGRAPGNPARQVTLEPDESASAAMHWASRVAGDCRPTSAYLRTFPPGSTEAITVPAEVQLCGDIFDVRTVTEGTDGIAA